MDWLREPGNCVKYDHLVLLIPRANSRSGITALAPQIQWSVTIRRKSNRPVGGVHSASQHVTALNKTLRGWKHQPPSQSVYSHGKDEAGSTVIQSRGVIADDTSWSVAANAFLSDE